MVVIVLIGVALTAATVMFHGLGTVLWIRFMRSRYGRGHGNAAGHERSSTESGNTNPTPSSMKIIWILCYTTVILAVLHVAEVALWATAYMSISGIEQPAGVEEAFYFSMVTFTSLGYGDVVISSPWRILSGIEAMAGMLVFGWSSALLLAALTRMLKIAESDVSDR